MTRKFDFKFRLDVKNKDNEFLTDNLVFLEFKDRSIREVVKLLNLSLRTAEQGLRVRQPKTTNFEVFNPKEQG